METENGWNTNFMETKVIMYQNQVCSQNQIRASNQESPNTYINILQIREK